MSKNAIASRDKQKQTVVTEYAFDDLVNYVNAVTLLILLSWHSVLNSLSVWVKMNHILSESYLIYIFKTVGSSVACFAIGSTVL